MKLSDLSTPPSGAVPWRALAGGSACIVHAQTWFAAREMATAVLGCARDEVVVVPVVLDEPAASPSQVFLSTPS